MRSINLTFRDTERIVKLLKIGQVGVMPTDTIYGIVGSALNPKTVEEIYTLRKRARDKPFIILISAADDLRKFDIVVNAKQKDFLQKVWPNPISVILTCGQEKFAYLHRGKKSLAFRVPKDKTLLDLLKRVGPLVAPSANIANERPAESIEAAKIYFGDKVHFYADEGKLKSKPSTIVRLYEDGSRLLLREGNFPAEKIL